MSANNREVRPLAASGRPSARNCEALSRTRYNSVRISNFGLKFLQYILNILYFRIKQKKTFDFFNPSYQNTTLIPSIITLRWPSTRTCLLSRKKRVQTTLIPRIHYSRIFEIFQGLFKGKLTTSTKI